MGLYAGFCALTHRDIKKVLAYSTLSQFGYMAVGLGLPGIALHLMTHAFFKALMFLGSGSGHACHHEQDILPTGIEKKMPVTAHFPYWCWQFQVFTSCRATSAKMQHY